tara:strand:- start:251 stop:1060 length:810 start_codon:yes stop_codon:yes gene_type:complete
MKIILNKSQLSEILLIENNIGFVPTMGAIHRGHISLVNKSKAQCRKTLVSIFINKPQFNNDKDFRNYPRTYDKDIIKLRRAKVDYLYLPKEKDIYPKTYNRKIKIDSFQKKLCGKFRPGHFKAVVDVIDRFIKIIKPTRIYLGEKDMQQLKIIEDFIKKNKIKTKINSCKTVRERNGIAISSRNLLLSMNEKSKASKVYKFIRKVKKKLINKKISIKLIKKKMFDLGVKKIDYVELHDINKIMKPFKKRNKYKIFIAYYLGSTRLIDNI